MYVVVEASHMHMQSYENYDPRIVLHIYYLFITFSTILKHEKLTHEN